MADFDPDHLQLTDFMDLPTLQEIQDGFAAVAGVKARITDAEGNLLTQPTPTREFLRRQKAIAAAAAEDDDANHGGGAGAAASAGPGVADGPQKEGREHVAPIIVANQRLGTIRMSVGRAHPAGAAAEIDDARLDALATRAGLDPQAVRPLLREVVREAAAARARASRPAAVQFLYLLANAIARLCFQEYQLRRRLDELTAVYSVAMTLSDARDLPTVLQRTVSIVCEVLKVKASSIRLVDAEKDELVIRAVHNLSDEYLGKGPIRLSRAEIDREALSSRGYSYVRDMATDPRVQYPEESRREGIASMLSVGMRYQGKPIGVLRVYTAEVKHFSTPEIDLLKAVAAQAAATIENARLLAESIAREALERQVAMAVDVQQRMVPRTPPEVPGLDVACAYVPCYALGGDLFDFIVLPEGNLGVVIADVSGKGVPASLIMASVRAAIRAHVDNVYYLYEVVRRLNVMLVRDTKPGEFVSLFYGVYNAVTRRLTYCNAGHPAALLLRDGRVSELPGSNMILGIDPDEPYAQSVIDLLPGDALLLYTDGLTDAMDFERITWGKHRLMDAFAEGGDSAEIIAQNVLWRMHKHAGLTPRSDDVTMVVLKVKPDHK